MALQPARFFGGPERRAYPIAQGQGKEAKRWRARFPPPLPDGPRIENRGCPAPGLINVMIYHQRMRTSGIDDPGGSGKMADRIFPRIQLRAKRLPSKPNLIGYCQLMLIKRLKACKFSEKQRPSLLYGNMDCRCAGCFNVSRCFLS